jgi:DEAD/DEAH box helicase domain-containing protein
MNRISGYIEALKASPRFRGQVTAHRYFSPHSGKGANVDAVTSGALQAMLRRQGIETLYAHQSDGLQAIQGGRHTIVATDTASGKSLIYNLALFGAVAQSQDVRGLYIYPLKALAQDQLAAFEQWGAAAPDIRATVAIYDGDTSAYRRRKIRGNPPNVLMTNPEMVHLALLPHHALWETFFRHLQYVVIDEIHAYRGILGCHMAGLMRRFLRICSHYQARPTFIFTSATVANPQQVAENITGLPIHTIDRSHAPRGGRHMLLLDPATSPGRAAILLLKAALARRLRTIVYVRSRKMAELITLWLQRDAGTLAEKISVYRAGLLPEERRRIERRLKDGRLLAVVSTSALELGIDIGDLDLCLLVGYPGSMISTWQRAGRVGRKGQESAVIMIADQDALDQYYVAHPEALFDGRPEPAVINPYNSKTLSAHLVCAAAESPLDAAESWLRQPQTERMVGDLERQGELLRSADGRYLYARRRRPHLEVNLRSAGNRYRLIVNDNTLIGEINGFRLYREAHPGAIYLHQGESYCVASVDESTRTVRVQPTHADYYTRVRTDGDVSILEVEQSIYYENTIVYLGKVKVTDHVIGYERVATANGRTLQRLAIETPPVVYTTEGLWCVIDASICRTTERMGHDVLGALHAAEHALIGVMPLVVLADRDDIGGLSTPFHPQTGSATIFVYDGIPGGAGFSRKAFKLRQRLFGIAGDVVERCACEEGCPACIHSPKCGSGNHPMDKAGACYLLNHLKTLGKPKRRSKIEIIQPAKPEPESASPKIRRYGVFDVETQRSAKEVGGWHMAHRMKISCAVVYDSEDDTFAVYYEADAHRLIHHLRQMDLVVGFNSKRFDYKVLSEYSDVDLHQLPSLDLLERVHDQLGFRLSLDHLARQTLNLEKKGSGLDALRWWQEGRMDKIIEYCQEDVRITRDLYLFARDRGYLIYRQKSGDRLRVPLTVP